MAKIKFYSKPTYLYRYRPLGKDSAREIRAIVDGFIYCSKFDKMNDPMEGKHRESLTYIMKGRSRAERAKIDEVKSKLGIASFSETYDHEPMWAHYADQFSGMCIAYSMSQLLKGLSDEHELVRMAYHEIPPTLLADRKSIVDKAKLTLATKSVRWMTEREWRLIIPEPGEANYGRKKCVVRVYLGTRVTRAAERDVREAMQTLKIPVLKMKIDKYKIDFSRTGE